MLSRGVGALHVRCLLWELQPVTPKAAWNKNVDDRRNNTRSTTVTKIEQAKLGKSWLI